MTKASKRLIQVANEAVAIARGEAKPSGWWFVFTATWDEDAKVWTAEAVGLPGLVTEAATLKELDAKLPGLVADLLDERQMAIATEVMKRRRNALRRLAKR